MIRPIDQAKFTETVKTLSGAKVAPPPLACDGCGRPAEWDCSDEKDEFGPMLPLCSECAMRRLLERIMDWDVNRAIAGLLAGDEINMIPLELRRELKIFVDGWKSNESDNEEQ